MCTWFRRGSKGLLWVWTALILGCGASAPGTAAPGTGGHERPGRPAGNGETSVVTAVPQTSRLPDTVVPTAYELELIIRPGEIRYSGRVRIAVRVTEPTRSMWLHGEDMTIDSASLVLADGRAMAMPAPRSHPDGLLSFALGEPLAPGSATLTIDFHRPYGERAGVFQQQVGGDSYVFTDFEPVDARRGFPCFDEPRFKTPWTVSVVVPAAMQALANMPELATEPMAGGLRRIRFAPTRPLPTYLVAVAVGPFELVEVPERAAPLVPIRIVVPRGHTAWATPAAAMAPELLRIVADYVGSPVPFPKLDFISVPRMSGAMENPGLITVGAHILLSNPDAPTIRQQRLLALVIAHELAHLWFGDLVTLRDWDDLWLNEGFATWLSYKALHAWRAEAMPHLEQVDAKAEAMAIDELVGARAVREVGHGRHNLQRIFDALSYKKGGAIVEMLEAWLGEDVFRTAMRAHLAAHADKSITTQSLGAALSAAAGRDVSGVLASFLEQPGIPQVDIALECRAKDNPTLVLGQKPYVALAEAELARAAGARRWRIPVCVRYPVPGGEARECMLLETETARFRLGTAHCPAWIVPNADADGYYRYRMAPAQLLAMARARLSAREVADLMHDLRALLYSGDARASEVLPVIDALAGAAGRQALEVAIGLLTELGEQVVTPPHAARFQAYVRGRFGKRARALGFAKRPGESDEDVLLRPRLLGFVGRYGGEPWIRTTALQLADTWLSSGAGIEAGMIEVTLRLAARSGGAELFQRMEAAARAAPDPELQSMILSAMAGFREPALVQQKLALMRDQSLGARHRLLLELLDATESRTTALEYLERHQAELLGEGENAFLLMAPLWADSYCSEDELNRAVALAAKLPNAQVIIGERVGALDQITRACIGFRTTHSDSVRGFLR